MDILRIVYDFIAFIRLLHFILLYNLIMLLLIKIIHLLLFFYYNYNFLFIIYLHDLLFLVDSKQVCHLSGVQQAVHILQEALLFNLGIRQEEHRLLALHPRTLQQVLLNTHHTHGHTYTHKHAHVHTSWNNPNNSKCGTPHTTQNVVLMKSSWQTVEQ